MKKIKKVKNGCAILSQKNPEERQDIARNFQQSSVPSVEGPGVLRLLWPALLFLYNTKGTHGCKSMAQAHRVMTWLLQGS